MPHKIFISRPTIIGRAFEVPYARFEKYFKRLSLEPCRLGVNNYTLDAPLTGVINLMKRCQGAIVLGYPQYEFVAGIAKGDRQEHQVQMRMPTPWNQIEATLAFRQLLPVLVVAHEGVCGGIFDQGVTGKYVLITDLQELDWHKKKEFQGVFHEWKSRLK